MELQGKVAWITGGARMGLEVAHALSQQGCRIVLSYRRSKDDAERAAKMLRAGGASVYIVRCDLSRPDEIRKAVQQVARHFGKLHVLVNLSSMYEHEKW